MFCNRDGVGSYAHEFRWAEDRTIGLSYKDRLRRVRCYSLVLMGPCRHQCAVVFPQYYAVVVLLLQMCQVSGPTSDDVMK